jgi:hypothetical protein
MRTIDFERLTKLEATTLPGVDIDLDVQYDQLSHIMHIDYQVRVIEPVLRLKDVWVMNFGLFIAIPEYLPREYARTSYATEMNVRQINGGLFDGRWQDDDHGKRFRAEVVVVCMIDAEEREFIRFHDYVFDGPNTGE